MSANGDDGSFGVCSNGPICDDGRVLRGVGGSDDWPLSHDGALSVGMGYVDKHHANFYV